MTTWKNKKFTYTNEEHYYINDISVDKSKYDREYEKQEFKTQLNRIERKLDRLKELKHEK